MKVCVLASGSRGNCTYLETNGTKSLIDIGMSTGYIERSLKEIGVEPSMIDNIFITHTHTDHINGLRVFLKKYNPTVYFTEKINEEIDMIIENYDYIDENVVINDLKVTAIKTSHDVADSNGYLFQSDGKSLVYITDTGYINTKYFNTLKNHDMYVLESNHDVQMLMDCNRPYDKKIRVLGDVGHLSNKDSAYYLSNFTTEKTKYVVLAHLSGDNNTADKAIETYHKTYEEGLKIAPEVFVAKAKERTMVFEF